MGTYFLLTHCSVFLCNYCWINEICSFFASKVAIPLLWRSKWEYNAPQRFPSLYHQWDWALLGREESGIDFPSAWPVNVIIFWKFSIHLVNKGRMKLSVDINQHTPLLSEMSPAKSLHQKNWPKVMGICYWNTGWILFWLQSFSWKLTLSLVILQRHSQRLFFELVWDQVDRKKITGDGWNFSKERPYVEERKGKCCST